MKDETTSHTFTRTTNSFNVSPSRDEDADVLMLMMDENKYTSIEGGACASVDEDEGDERVLIVFVLEGVVLDGGANMDDVVDDDTAASLLTSIRLTSPGVNTIILSLVNLKEHKHKRAHIQHV